LLVLLVYLATVEFAVDQSLIVLLK